MTTSHQAPGTALEAALAQLVLDAHRRRSLARDVTTGHRRQLVVDRRSRRTGPAGQSTAA